MFLVFLFSHESYLFILAKNIASNFFITFRLITILLLINSCHCKVKKILKRLLVIYRTKLLLLSGYLSRVASSYSSVYTFLMLHPKYQSIAIFFSFLRARSWMFDTLITLSLLSIYLSIQKFKHMLTDAPNYIWKWNYKEEKVDNQFKMFIFDISMYTYIFFRE